MANHLAVTVPLANIRSIQIYMNSPRKSLAAIKKATGADYILNGTLYNMSTGAVNCHLKAAGRVIARPAYTVYGYAWDEGPDIAMRVLPAETQNYIACTPLIVDGKKLDKLTYDAGQGGKRGRSAFGIKGEKAAPHIPAGSAEAGSAGPRLALYCTRDGSGAARTPEQLRDDLAAAGWDSAVMLDGGGSSQCDFDGEQITSSRKVQHLILVFCKKGDAFEIRGEKPMVEINAYSKKQDGGKKLSTNFTVKEFACKDGSDAVFVAPRLVMVLQSIRSHFGKAVNIHSGYRTPAYNTKVGGVEQSQHTYGTAADISITGVTPAQVAAYARSIMPDWGGVGIYAKQGFTHVDVRDAKADWTE